MKNFLTVRKVLTFFLLLSLCFATYRAYYKIKYWGFSFDAHEKTRVYNIDAHISFMPTGEPIEVSFGVPQESDSFKILNEDTAVKGYEVQKSEDDSRLILTTTAKKKPQNLYYRISVYDNKSIRGKLKDEKPTVTKPLYDDLTTQQAEDIWAAASVFEGREPQKIIALFNQQPLDSTLNAFLPVQLTEKQRVEKMVELLAFKGIAARLARGVRLEESRQESEPDLMLEAYDGDKWRLYDIYSGADGLPKNFVVFGRGGASLLDVRGGKDSEVRFSVLRAMATSFKLAEHRAKLNDSVVAFEHSVYSLPLVAQSALKWLMIFPLGILITVLMRNVIGLKTMGTFTPMLIALALVKTGFWAGLIGFSLILGLGILIRLMFSKLNLLLVPRIAAVVIFVILLIQVMSIIGFRYDLDFAISALFFPVIITAWVIERASIIWEEEGGKNTFEEIAYSMLTAVITYFVISSEQIRYLMFAFSEFNISILFVVMLLGTYTGYRLTELARFSPLVKEG